MKDEWKEGIASHSDTEGLAKRLIGHHDVLEESMGVHRDSGIMVDLRSAVVYLRGHSNALAKASGRKK